MLKKIILTPKKKSCKIGKIENCRLCICLAMGGGFSEARVDGSGQGFVGGVLVLVVGCLCLILRGLGVKKGVRA